MMVLSFRVHTRISIEVGNIHISDAASVLSLPLSSQL